MFKMNDITGKKFGKLTAIKPVGKTKRGGYSWLCKCDCGGEKVTSLLCLTNGNTTSCGCVITNTSHNMSRTRLYKIWTGMKMRCYTESHASYQNYGGRGIQVCDEWKNSFQSFADWAFATGYNENLTIDRKDNDKDYYPENCRWVPLEFQERNKKNSFYAEYDGKKIPVAILCDELNLPVQVIYHRIIRGATFEEAVTKPIRYRSESRKQNFNECATHESVKEALSKLSSQGLY